jgi:hypothetical protein
VARNELNGQLTNAKNTYLLALSAASLFASPEVYPVLARKSVQLGDLTFSCSQVVNLLRKPADRDIAVKEFLNAQMRALVKESFDLVLDYCNETEQRATLQAAPWFHFVRLIRNCLTHNGLFQFSDDDYALLPVTWNRREITRSMNYQHLRLEFFGHAEAWALFSEIEGFVGSQLQ